MRWLNWLFILMGLLPAAPVLSDSDRQGLKESDAREAKGESTELAIGEKLTGDLSVEANAGYDSNVSVDEIDLTTARSDHFAVFGLDGELEYDYSAQTKLDAGYKLTDKRFGEFDNLNSQINLLSTGISHKFSEVRAGLSYRFIDADLGGEGFLNISQWSPVISGFVSRQHFLRLGAVHGRKWFAENRERNATNNEISLDYFYFINGVRHYVTAGVKFKQEDTDAPAFDYDQQQLRLRYLYLAEILNIPVRYKLGWRYQRRDYDEFVDPSIGDFRLDKRFQYEAAMEFRLGQGLSSELSFEFKDNQSNLSRVDYVERIISLGLAYGF